MVTVPDQCTAQALAEQLNMPLKELVKQARALGESVDGDTVLSAELIELLLGLFSPAEALQFIEASETPRPARKNRRACAALSAPWPKRQMLQYGQW